MPMLKISRCLRLVVSLALLDSIDARSLVISAFSTKLSAVALNSATVGSCSCLIFVSLFISSSGAYLQAAAFSSISIRHGNGVLQMTQPF